MAKKPISVSIRKASSQPQSDKFENTKEAFVSGRPGFRSLTLYLPDALVEKLAAHCKATDRDMSALVAEVMEKHLAGTVIEKPEIDSPVTSLMKWVESRFPRIASLRPAWLF